jgi:hypothetical protein
MSTIVNVWTVTGAAFWAALVTFALGLCRRAASQDAMLARSRPAQRTGRGTDA